MWFIDSRCVTVFGLATINLEPCAFSRTLFTLTPDQRAHWKRKNIKKKKGCLLKMEKQGFDLGNTRSRRWRQATRNWESEKSNYYLLLAPFAPEAEGTILLTTELGWLGWSKSRPCSNDHKDWRLCAVGAECPGGLLVWNTNIPVQSQVRDPCYITLYSFPVCSSLNTKGEKPLQKECICVTEEVIPHECTLWCRHLPHALRKDWVELRTRTMTLKQLMKFSPYPIYY